jgi:hypothetical protein
MIRRDGGTTPRILDEREVALQYSAVSNPDDPAPGRVAGG